MIIQCPECRSKISDKASACPKCGFPMSSQFSEITEALSFGPKCPYCKSNRIQDIDAGRRGQIFAEGGFLKAFTGTKECRTCGKTW